MADIPEIPENAPVQAANEAAGPLQVPAAPPADAAAAKPDVAGPASRPTAMQKMLAYGKKNWWLILLPLPVIVIVVAFKHRKK